MLDLAVTADNARFASVGGDKQVFLWDVETGTTVRRWSGHDARVEAVEFGGEADSIVASGMFFVLSFLLFNLNSFYWVLAAFLEVGSFTFYLRVDS